MGADAILSSSRVKKAEKILHQAGKGAGSDIFWYLTLVCRRSGAKNLII
jgi:hypothetical protein